MASQDDARARRGVQGVFDRYLKLAAMAPKSGSGAPDV